MTDVINNAQTLSLFFSTSGMWCNLIYTIHISHVILAIKLYIQGIIVILWTHRLWNLWYVQVHAATCCNMPSKHRKITSYRQRDTSYPSDRAQIMYNTIFYLFIMYTFSQYTSLPCPVHYKWLYKHTNTSHTRQHHLSNTTSNFDVCQLHQRANIQSGTL